MTLDQETDKSLAYIYSNGKAVYGLDNNYNSNYRQEHILQNMYENNLAFSDKPYIRLKAHGIKIQEGGGWLKYLEQQQENIKNQPPIVSNNINISGGVIGSQIGQDSEFGDLCLDIKSKKEIKQIPIETPKLKSSQDIWDKLKSVAQILGFGAAFIALITKLMDLW